ncbi:hypothetical protein MANES_13G100775v8 [Manihot esculenta]|uniref:Uncharacterized protein n=1 Tax=Manihot esculenta TaxID=3983 RepID=A0ACB7GL01_MANES|nr:hypothetical protein MANES_13G100775v8 [Manihot esculenta]
MGRSPARGPSPSRGPSSYGLHSTPIPPFAWAMHSTLPHVTCTWAALHTSTHVGPAFTIHKPLQRQSLQWPSRAHGLHLHGTKAALQFTSSKRAHIGSTKVLQQLTLTRTKAPQQCTGPIHATHEAHAWAPPFPPVDQDPFTHKHVDPPQLTLHAHDRSTSHFHAPPLQLHVDTRTLDPLPGQQFS